jgi:hypothetical protein
MVEERRPRIRFRLRTVLLVVAFVALILVIVIQQVQMGRMIAAQAKEREQLGAIIRELRDHLDRQK